VLEKSTVASNLALALVQLGASVGLVDADIYGPSQTIMFDVVHERPDMKEIDGKNMIIPVESYGVKLLSIGFLLIHPKPLYGADQWLQKR